MVIKLLQADQHEKRLNWVEKPTKKQVKQMEQIVENLYKRITVYKMLQKNPVANFSPLLSNKFTSLLSFDVKYEAIDYETLDFQPVDKIKANILKGKARLYDEKQLWNFLFEMLNICKAFKDS